MARITGTISGVTGDTTRRTTTQEFPLGEFAFSQTGKWQYVRAGATIAQYDAVVMEGSAAGYDAVVPTSAVTDLVVGVADAAFADEEYGWIQVQGVCTAKVNEGDTALLPVGGSASAGVLTTYGETVPCGGKPIVALVTGVATGSEVYLG